MRDRTSLSQKITPLAIGIAITSLCVLLIAFIAQRSWEHYRPDLPYRLITFDQGLNLTEAEQFRNKTGVPVFERIPTRTFKGIFKIADPYLNQDDDRVVEIDSCLFLGKNETIVKRLYFDFPFTLTEIPYVNLNSPEIVNFPNLIPITASIAYEDPSGDEYIYVNSIVLDENLDEIYRSKIQIPFITPSGTYEIGNAVIGGGKLNQYLIYGLGPSNHIDKRKLEKLNLIDSPFEEQMRSHFGLVVDEINHNFGLQSKWEIYDKETIRFTKSPYLYHIRPYGGPCVFAHVGSSGAAWNIESNTVLSTQDSSTLNEPIEIQASYSYFDLIEIRDIPISKGTLIISQNHPDCRFPYSIYIASSAHGEKDSLSEISALTRPIKATENSLCNDQNYRNYFTRSHTSEGKWYFDSTKDDETIIHNLDISLHSTAHPFEFFDHINDSLLGFVLFVDNNESVTVLRQPKYYTKVEPVWDNPITPSNPGTKFNSFLGVLRLRDDTCGFVFATTDNKIVIVNDKAEQLSLEPANMLSSTIKAMGYDSIVSTFLNRPNNPFITASSRIPLSVILRNSQSPDKSRTVNLEINDYYTPHWGTIRSSIISGLLALWAVGIFLVVRHQSEKKFVSYQEYQSTLTRAQDEVKAERDKHSITAHEIRNPLHAIRGFTKLMLEDEQDPEKRETAEMIIKETDRLDSILKKLLAFTREIKPEFQDVPLDIWWNDLKPLAKEMAKSANINCEWHDPPNQRAIFDSNLMHQVFINLFKNAIEASKENDTIKLSLSTNRHDVILRIEDNGIGISPENAKQVFEGFKSSKIEGSGIGLPLSKRIVRAHDGDLFFDLNIKQGAAIVAIWPIQPSKKILSPTEQGEPLT